MVFQDGALFPHLSVGDNVGFGSPRKGRVEECLELVGLADRARSYPHELSGGERQRVALARALATDPEVVLLDEPFASLDAGLRTALREEVAAILRGAGASALLVTHDQQEALSLADSISLMRAGRIEQVGGPEDVYARAGDAVGGGVPRRRRRRAGRRRGRDGDVRAGSVRRWSGSASGPVDVLVRPETVGLCAAGGDGSASTRPADPVPATVVGRSFYGADQLIVLRLGSGLTVRSRRPGFVPWQVGDVVDVWLEGPVTVLPAGCR